MDGASQNFQLALQLAYLEMGKEIDTVLHDGSFTNEAGERLTRRAFEPPTYSVRTKRIVEASSAASENSALRKHWLSGAVGPQN